MGIQVSGKSWFPRKWKTHIIHGPWFNQEVSRGTSFTLIKSFKCFVKKAFWRVLSRKGILHTMSNVKKVQISIFRQPTIVWQFQIQCPTFIVKTVPKILPIQLRLLNGRVIDGVSCVHSLCTAAALISICFSTLPMDSQKCWRNRLSLDRLEYFPATSTSCPPCLGHLCENPSRSFYEILYCTTKHPGSFEGLVSARAMICT